MTNQAIKRKKLIILIIVRDLIILRDIWINEGTESEVESESESEPEPEPEMPAYVIIGEPSDRYYRYDTDFYGVIDVWPNPIPVDLDADGYDDGYLGTFGRCGTGLEPVDVDGVFDGYRITDYY